MPNSEYISANHPVIEISLAITRRTIHFCVCYSSKASVMMVLCRWFVMVSNTGLIVIEFGCQIGSGLCGMRIISLYLVGWVFG